MIEKRLNRQWKLTELSLKCACHSAHFSHWKVAESRISAKTEMWVFSCESNFVLLICQTTIVFFLGIFQPAPICRVQQSIWSPTGNIFIVLINRTKMIGGVFLESENHGNYILVKVKFRTKSNYIIRYKAQKPRRWRGGLDRWPRKRKVGCYYKKNSEFKCMYWWEVKIIKCFSLYKFLWGF